MTCAEICDILKQREPAVTMDLAGLPLSRRGQRRHEEWHIDQSNLPAGGDETYSLAELIKDGTNIAVGGGDQGRLSRQSTMLSR